MYLTCSDCIAPTNNYWSALHGTFKMWFISCLNRMSQHQHKLRGKMLLERVRMRSLLTLLLLLLTIISSVVWWSTRALVERFVVLNLTEPSLAQRKYPRVDCGFQKQTLWSQEGSSKKNSPGMRPVYGEFLSFFNTTDHYHGIQNSYTVVNMNNVEK